MKYSISLTTEATPTIAERLIRAAVKSALNAGRGQHYTPEWVEAVEVTEGAEKCGYGKLYVTGLVRHFDGAESVPYRVDASGSQWKNWGRPDGTKYEITIVLEKESVSAETAK